MVISIPKKITTTFARRATTYLLSERLKTVLAKVVGNPDKTIMRTNIIMHSSITITAPIKAPLSDIVLKNAFNVSDRYTIEPTNIV